MLEFTGYPGDTYPVPRRLSWQQDSDSNDIPVRDFRRFLDVKTEEKLWKSLEDLTKPDQNTVEPEKSFRSLKFHRKKRSTKNLCRQQAFVFPSQENMALEGGSSDLKARSLVLTGRTKRVVVSRNQTITNSSPHLYQQSYSPELYGSSYSVQSSTNSVSYYLILEHGIFGEGSQISTNQKREISAFSRLIG